MRKSTLKGYLKDGRFLSLVITTIVIFLILYSGPSSALLININSPREVIGGEIIEFPIDITINGGELIPITRITLNITGPSSVDCDINLTDNSSYCIDKISRIATSDVNVTVEFLQPLGYGYGYRYAEWNGTPYYFGYGYGYGGYGYGYGYGAVPATLRLNVTWKVPITLTNTTYKIKVSVYADGKIFENEQTVNILPPTTTTTSTTTTVPSTAINPPTTTIIPSISLAPRISIKLIAPNEISQQIGTTKSYNVTVYNNGNVRIDRVYLDINGLPKDWYSLPNPVSLQVNETKVLTFTLTIPSDEKPRTLIFNLTAYGERVSDSKEIKLTLTSVPSSPLPQPICGNDFCEPGEDWINCCKDCGCPEGYECKDNACIKIQTTTTTIQPVSPLTGLVAFIASPIGIASILSILIVIGFVLFILKKKF